MRRNLALVTVMLGSVTLLAGCYAEDEGGRTQRVAPADSAETTEEAADTSSGQSSSGSTGGGANSTYGKAKQSAKRTIGRLEERDKELQKQIDED